MSLKVPLLPADIACMTDIAAFSVQTKDIRVQNRETQITISLHLRYRNSSQEKYPISGFPRVVMNEQAHRGMFYGVYAIRRGLKSQV